MLVGCGVVADYGHLPAIKENKRARLVSVVDKDLEKARASAAKFDAETWSDDYRKVLAGQDIDVAVITTPPSAHAKIAIDCLESGRDVLCEKPLTSTLNDALRVVEVVRRTGKHLMVGYILRHNDIYKKARALIRDGRLGFPLVIRLMGAEHYEQECEWTRALGLLKDSSPVIDCGCHYADLMRWFTASEAVSVSGIGQRLHPDVPEDKYDYGLMTVRMEDGSVGIYEVGWGYNMRAFSTKQILGPGGRIDILYPSLEEGREEVTLEYYSRPQGLESYGEEADVKQMDRQFEEFLKNAEEKVDPIPALEDAVKSLEIVLAGHKAITTGKVVHLNHST